jgi:hypothetical protein
MIKKLLYFSLILINIYEINSQTISGKIININSLDPIEKAAIITNIKSGTTSDKFGNYTLNLNNVKTITFSCLGYLTKTITKNQLIKRNYVVNLIENVNQLDEFQLNIAKISLDSLLIKTTLNMKENYLSSPIKQELYTVENQKMDFKKLDFELKSSSLLNRKNRKLAEQDLKTFSDELQKRNPTFGSEFKVTLLSAKLHSEKLKKDIDSYQVEDAQGYKKIDIGNGITVENLTKKLQNIVLKHLSYKNTYKVKSGLFKVEDSLSFAKASKVADSLAKDNTFNNFNQSYSIRNAKKMGTFFNVSSEKNFLNQKYYEHQLEENEILGSKKHYVISFTPNKSKYSGKIYVDPSNFYIKKIAYTYAEGKRGEHLNLKFLFGIKFSENKHDVTLYYEKNEDNKVYTSYISETKSNYAYIDRPLKFIENSKDKNKITFNIKVEINVTENREIYLKTPNYIDANKIKKLTKEEIKKRTLYMTKEAYENSDWKNKVLIHQYLEKYN